eukprot:COSAG06_NODE_1327_length_9855_cov_3.900574_14_plen_103_part_00
MLVTSHLAQGPVKRLVIASGLKLWLRAAEVFRVHLQHRVRLERVAVQLRYILTAGALGQNAQLPVKGLGIASGLKLQHRVGKEPRVRLPHPVSQEKVTALLI